MQSGSSASRLHSRYTMTVFRDGFHASFHIDDRNITHFLHYHDYYEITFYFGEKSLEFLYDGVSYTLRRGDIIFCDIFKPHVYECADNTGCDRFDFGITPQLLTQFSLPGQDYLQLFRGTADRSPIVHCDFFMLGKYIPLVTEYRAIAESGGDRGVQEALLHLIIAYLYRDCEERIALAPAADTHSALVNTLTEYISAHLSEKLALEELAARTNYSVSYISRIFKETTGQTIVRYILDKRIMAAKQFILQGMPLGEVAEAVGFPSYSYFYRCFLKSEGVSPREYRKR